MGAAVTHPAAHGVFSQIAAEVGRLKAAAVHDFARLEQLVEDGIATVTESTAAAAGEPDVSNVPSDASTVVPRTPPTTVDELAETDTSGGEQPDETPPAVVSTGTVSTGGVKA